MKKLPVLLLLAGSLSLSSLCQAQYTDLLDFNGTNGANPKGSFVLTGGVLYGLTSNGGASTDGNVFSIHPDGTHMYSFFSFNATNGSFPDGSLIYTVGPKIYGMTSSGGSKNAGDIFSVDTGGQHFINRWNFSLGASDSGSIPFGSLIVSGRKLYGMTSGGGLNGKGNVFCIDTNGLNYKDLHDFGGPDGQSPQGSLVLIHNELYGMTEFGGANLDGVVFSVDTNGGNYKDRWDFGTSPNTNGVNPTGSLTLVGKLLFGMTQSGGINGDGNIFSIDTNASGTTYKDRWDFNVTVADSNGGYPDGDLTYSGKLLYGMTSAGGRNGDGNIFYIDTAGTRYHDIFDFNGASGQGASGNVTLSGNVIYGMTPFGGAHGNGVVFSDTLIKVTTTDTNISCNGSNNGFATAYVTGGFSPYTYSWTGGSTTNKTSALSVGTYTVTITDNNGLVVTASLSISQPSAVAVTIASSTDVGCFGGATGDATANTATGGTGAYTYIWSDAQTGKTATGLSAGTYTITAKDAHGCTGTASVTITQPASALGVTIASNTNETCNGDATATATANTATGGSTPYTYSWSTTPTQTGQTATGLTAGSYTVTVTDSHGCTATAKATVTQPTAVGFNVNSLPNTDSVTYNGSVGVAPYGGVGPYTYLWAPGGQTTDSIIGQNGGSYTCTVTDANGCTYSARVIVDNTAGVATITNTNGQITIYPNPNNGVFAIKSVGLNGKSIVEIYNVLGEKVYSQTSTFNSPLTINLTSQPAGIYLYRIVTQNGNLAGIGKLIIQK